MSLGRKSWAKLAGAVSLEPPLLLSCHLAGSLMFITKIILTRTVDVSRQEMFSLHNNLLFWI